MRALGSGPPYHGRDVLSLHPRELDTRGPLADEGGKGEIGTKASVSAPHLRPLSHATEHPFVCVQLGESETASLWNSGA